MNLKIMVHSGRRTFDPRTIRYFIQQLEWLVLTFFPRCTQACLRQKTLLVDLSLWRHLALALCSSGSGPCYLLQVTTIPTILTRALWISTRACIQSQVYLGCYYTSKQHQLSRLFVKEFIMFITIMLIVLFMSPFILIMLGTYKEYKDRLDIEEVCIKDGQFYNRNLNSYRSKPSLYVVRKDK